MKLRKVKKGINKLKCEVFKRNALRDLRMINIWACHENGNSRSNMRILTKNFMRNGKFINNGVW